MVEELILSGADIIKVGIGPGKQACPLFFLYLKLFLKVQFVPPERKLVLVILS